MNEPAAIAAQTNAQNNANLEEEPGIPVSIDDMPLLRRGYSTAFPKAFDLVTTVLYLGALGLYLYDRAIGNYGWRLELVPTVIVTATIVSLLCLERWERWFYGLQPPARVSAAIFVTRMALIEVVAQLDNFSFSPFLYLVIPFSGFLYKGMRFCYLLAGLVLTVYVVKLSVLAPQWLADGNIVREFLIFLVGLLFMITMAHVVESQMRSRAHSEMLLAQLEESHRQLRAYSEQVADLATAKERNRLARDIHDSLGHYLTVINVQLEKALAFREARPDEAWRALNDTKRLASEALRDVRRSVGVLRTGPEKEDFSLRRALDDMVEHTGTGELHIELRITGSEGGFAAQSLMALYRVAQEGLTNVQKHSGADRATIEVDFGPEEAKLCIRDNGRGFDVAAQRRLGAGPGASGAGYGLQGLEERVELLGGSFQVSSTPGGGATLSVTVPREGRPRASTSAAALSGSQEPGTQQWATASKA